MEDAAYSAVIPMITQAEREDSNVSNGIAIFDLGLKAFLTSPEDERAQRVLTYLGLLSEALSDTDRRAFEKKYAERLGPLLAGSDLTEKTREGLIYMGIWHEAAFLYLNPAVSSADLVSIRSRIDALENSRLELPWVAPQSKWLEVLYGDLLTKIDSLAAKTFWGKLAGNGDQDVAAIARGKLNFVELRLRQTPMEIQFTAADGRHVDLREMRGKVVLIDFWATWCPFCLAELPSLKKAYDAYHEQGFEIVCISCEYAGVNPGDSDEARERKLDATRLKLLRFVDKWKLPWPQYFDGKGLTPNEYATRFGVDSMPAQFLLDRDGRLAETNDPGIRFDVVPLVKKLLASPTHGATAGVVSSKF